MSVDRAALKSALIEVLDEAYRHGESGRESVFALMRTLSVGLPLGRVITDAILAVPAAPERAFIERIVREDEERVQRENAVANAHNNTDGVGINFDYMNGGKPASWYEDAKALLDATRPEPAE